MFSGVVTTCARHLVSAFSHGETDGLADPGIGPGHSGQQSRPPPKPISHARIDVKRVIGPTFGRKLRPAPGVFLSCRRDHWRHHRSPGGVTIVSAMRASNITKGLYDVNALCAQIGHCFAVFRNDEEFHHRDLNPGRSGESRVS